jgi:chain length determinant protein (polysaccharide antigen chain regulator)
MTEKVIESRQDDEIDLFDLIDDIRDKWYLVLGYFFVGVVLAVVYALNASPLYKTELVLRDAPASDLLTFNQPALRTTLQLVSSEKKDESGDPVELSNEPVFELSSDAAFMGVRAVVRSATARKAFYQTILSSESSEIKALLYNDELTEEQNLAKFLELFSFADSNSKTDQDIFLEVNFELKDAELARDLLNDYVDFALLRYENQIRQELGRKVQSQLQLNQSWASSFRDAYESEKARRIALLDEAAAVAVSIGQTKPFYNTNDVVVSSEPPLYMMGELALKREAEQLKQRSNKASEDVFIEGMSAIRGSISTLENMKVDWESVNFALIDQPALLPIKPIKPRKVLIVALGGVGGFMFGLLAALLAAASARHLHRDRKSENSLMYQ